MSRCKRHKNLIKEAVIACNAFPASHSSNTMALKKIGIVLSDFDHGEAEDPYHQNEQDLKVSLIVYLLTIKGIHDAVQSGFRPYLVLHYVKQFV